MKKNNRVAIVVITCVISLIALRVSEKGFIAGGAFIALELSFLFLAVALGARFIDGGD